MTLPMEFAVGASERDLCGSMSIEEAFEDEVYALFNAASCANEAAAARLPLVRYLVVSLRGFLPPLCAVKSTTTIFVPF